MRPVVTCRGRITSHKSAFGDRFAVQFFILIQTNTFSSRPVQVCAGENGNARTAIITFRVRPMEALDNLLSVLDLTKKMAEATSPTVTPHTRRELLQEERIVQWMFLLRRQSSRNTHGIFKFLIFVRILANRLSENVFEGVSICLRLEGRDTKLVWECVFSN